MKKSLDYKGYTGAVLMSLSEPFDTIKHEIFIAKLCAFRFCKNALKLIFSYMSYCWQKSKINKSFSSWFSLLQRVPRGSILGAILFNIYINNLFHFV